MESFVTGSNIRCHLNLVISTGGGETSLSTSAILLLDFLRCSNSGKQCDLKNRGDTVYFDVGAAIPGRNVNKDSSRRILRKVMPVDLVNNRKHIKNHPFDIG
jgi:hypothetical protein